MPQFRFIPIGGKILDPPIVDLFAIVDIAFGAFDAKDTKTGTDVVDGGANVIVEFVSR